LPEISSLRELDLPLNKSNQARLGDLFRGFVSLGWFRIHVKGIHAAQKKACQITALTAPKPPN